MAHYPIARREQYRRYLAPPPGGTARGGELELRGADDSTVPVEVSVGTAEIGGRRAIVGVFAISAIASKPPLCCGGVRSASDSLFRMSPT